MTSVTKIPQTFANDDPGGGSVAWTNPGNAIASDNVYATSALPSNGNTTQRLKATNCGFAIPIGARIEGIAVAVEVSITAGTVADFGGPLLYRAGVTDSLSAVLKTWTVTDTVLTYGGPTDMWGAAWTASDINNSGFGVAIRAKITAGAPGTMQVDAITITVYYTLPGGVTTTCVWREPTGKRSALFTTDITAAKWQHRIRGMSTASLLVPKSDPNAAKVANLIAKCVPCISIERSDGVIPFVGYPVDPRFKRSDTHGAFQLADHTMLLSQASTRIAAETRQASGRFIIDELTAAIGRGELLALDLRQVPAVSPPASLALSGGTLEAMLRELERQTGYEAFLTHQISNAAVVTFLQWRKQQGKDRRTEDRWSDGDNNPQFADLQYNLNYRSKGSVTSVGGTGSVPARASATATVTAAPVIGASRQVVPRTGRAGYGGAQVDFVPQVTDPQLLQSRNVTILASPTNAAVSWEGGLIEGAPAVDMSRISVGDTRRIATVDGVMGQPASGFARLVSINVDADFGVHSTIWVGV